MFSIALQDVEIKDTIFLSETKNLPKVDEIISLNDKTYIIEKISNTTKDSRNEGLYVLSIRKISIQ